MIRLLLVLILVIVYLILSIILIPLMYLIGLFSKKARDYSSLRLIQGLFKTILFLSGVKTKVIGKENIPKDEAVLFVGNHHGFFDVIVAYSLMPNLTGFIAKKEMCKVYGISNWMDLLHCLFIDRSSPRAGLKTILDGIEVLKSGISLVIFPEGTRNKSDEGILPFHAGSFKLATKSKVKIIPMTQTHTSEVFEKHLPWLKATHTSIEFGKPIDVTTLTPNEEKILHETCQNLILETYNKNLELYK